MAFVYVDGDWIRTRAGSKGVWQGGSYFYIRVIFLGRERNSGNSPPTYWMVTQTIHVTSSEQKVHAVGQVAMDHNSRMGEGWGWGGTMVSSEACIDCQHIRVIDH